MLLRGYFDLCAAADDVALANVARVTLDPQRDGVVGHFRILRVASRPERPAGEDPGLVSLSLSPSTTAVLPDDAVLAVKDIEVMADVHRAGGLRPAPMTVTLARAVAAGFSGRWIVVRLVLDGRTLPAASSGRR